MTKRTKRLKGPELPTPATLAEAEALLDDIGRQQRRVQVLEADMAGRMAEVKAGYEQAAAPAVEAIEAGFASLQAWAEAHRGTLLEDGRKTARLATGELGWRTSPLSVRISGVEKVLAAFKQLGLDRFIRVKEEPDKEAIRREPKAVAAVKGVSIARREEFWVKPFESEIERSRIRKVGR